MCNVCIQSLWDKIYYKYALLNRLKKALADFSGSGSSY